MAKKKATKSKPKATVATKALPVVEEYPNEVTAIGMYRNRKGWVTVEVQLKDGEVVSYKEQDPQMKVGAFSKLKIEFIKKFWRERKRKS